MSFAERIQKIEPMLSKSERRVAQVLFSTNLVAGLETVAKLAEVSQVSGPTVLRFIGKLDFTAYADFQTALRSDLSDRVSSPLQLFESRAPKATQHAILQDAREVFQRGIERTFDRLSDSDFEAVVAALSDKSRTAYMIGGRFTQHLAEILWGHILQLRPDAHVLRAGVLAPHDLLLDIRRRDVVVVFDLRRYQGDVIELAEEAKRRQATIILFTDQWLSPIARVAHHVLTCDVEAPSPYDSLVCCLALLEAIVAGVTERCGETGRRRVSDLESLRGRNLIMDV